MRDYPRKRCVQGHVMVRKVTTAFSTGQEASGSDTLVTGHFAYRTLTTGQFAYCLVISPTGHFAYWSFRLRDISPTAWTVRLQIAHCAYLILFYFGSLVDKMKSNL